MYGLKNILYFDIYFGNRRFQHSWFTEVHIKSTKKEKKSKTFNILYGSLFLSKQH